jgi:hypothetical protein
MAGRPRDGNMGAVGSEFRKLMASDYPGQPLPHNVSKFVRGWVKAWMERSNMRSRSPSPRRSHLPDEVVDECYNALLAGYNKGRRHCHYRSFRHALKRNGTLRSALATYTHDDGRPLLPSTLYRRIKERHPGLSRRLLRFVRKKSSTEKEERVQYCSKLLAMTAAARRQYLSRVMWLDAAEAGTCAPLPPIIWDAERRAPCPLLPPCRQRRRQGKRANGPTAQEFLSVMERIRESITARLEEPEWREAWVAATGGAPKDEGYQPIYSFDNTGIHRDHDVLVELGFEREFKKGEYEPTPSWLVLPTYSGDLHRTIERVHARICGAFEEWLDDDCAKYDMVDYINKLFKIFMTSQSHTLIENCMFSPQHPAKSLSALYQSIVNIGGGIPARQLR